MFRQVTKDLLLSNYTWSDDDINQIHIIDNLKIFKKDFPMYADTEVSLFDKDDNDMVIQIDGKNYTHNKDKVLTYLIKASRNDLPNKYIISNAQLIGLDQSVNEPKRKLIRDKYASLFGNKCPFCEYEEENNYKLYSNVDFHHLDPQLKYNGLSDLNTGYGETIKLELFKCVPCCKSCHIKIHQFIIPINEVLEYHLNIWTDILNNHPDFVSMQHVYLKNGIPIFSPLNKEDYPNYFLNEKLRVYKLTVKYKSFRTGTSNDKESNARRIKDYPKSEYIASWTKEQYEKINKIMDYINKEEEKYIEYRKCYAD